MSTTVVNIRDRGGFDVYIGRAARRALDARARVESPFANPYTERACGTREAAVARYEELMRRRLVRGGAVGVVVGVRAAAWSAERWRRELLALRGTRLGCWCHPDPCHGHVLVRLIDELVEGRLPEIEKGSSVNRRARA